MKFLDLAKSRYTTKKYDSKKTISNEIINDLKKIIQLSPSSINSQPWKFSFVSNTDLKNEFANASFWNAQKIKDASHLVIFSVIDDLGFFEEQINKSLNKGNIDFYNDYIKTKGEFEIKSWLKHQVYLSLGFFLSACISLEIDSTPMEGINQEEYDRILKNKGYKTLFAVCIGYRDVTDNNQPSFSPKSRIDEKYVIETLD